MSNLTCQESKGSPHERVVVHITLNVALLHVQHSPVTTRKLSPSALSYSMNTHGRGFQPALSDGA